MAKIDRLLRLDQRRADLEAEYRETLAAALERTAAGKPGLFNHRADKRERAAVAPMIDELRSLGDAIDGLREQLQIEPFALHRDFFDARGRSRRARSANPGKSKHGLSGWGLSGLRRQRAKGAACARVIGKLVVTRSTDDRS